MATRRETRGYGVKMVNFTKIDLIGRKFDLWTVISVAPNKGKENDITCWNCLCDCGNTKVVRGNSLKAKKTKSCGCYKVSLVGRRFGLLTVVSAAPNKGKNTCWNCLCDCGNMKIVRGDKLKDNETNTCGCYLKSILFYSDSHSGVMTAALAKDIATTVSAKCVFKSHYSDAGLNFNTFLALTKQNCFYCNLPAEKSNSYNYFSRNSIKIETGFYFYNGLDRINPALLHDAENCVPCCLTCNRYKLNLPIKEFLTNIKALLRPFFLKRADELNSIINKLSEFGVSKFSELYSARSVHNSNIFVKQIGNKKIIAKRRGLEFGLTQLECAELICAPCCYCGRKPNTQVGIFNGIDRVDNSIGYAVSNCVSCCRYCNTAKNNLELTVFDDWATRIKAYYPQLQEKIKNDPRFQ